MVDIRPNVYDPEKLKVVEDAYQFSLEKYDGKYMVSGKAYLFHLIDLARIAVLEVGLGYMSVVAAFLHGITYKEQVDMDYLEERFGKRIATVLKGFDKISALHTERVAYNSDNFRDLFLSLVEDMRTVLQLGHHFPPEQAVGIGNHGGPDNPAAVSRLIHRMRLPFLH